MSLTCTCRATARRWRSPVGATSRTRTAQRRSPSSGSTGWPLKWRNACVARTSTVAVRAARAPERAIWISCCPSGVSASALYLAVRRSGGAEPLGAVLVAQPSRTRSNGRRRRSSSGRRSLPPLRLASSCGSTSRRASMGIANPTPWPCVVTEVLIPTTRPRRSKSGPPRLPGLMAASVCGSLRSRYPRSRCGRSRTGSRGR